MSRIFRQYPHLILLVVCIALTLLTYGMSLWLPLYMDDVILTDSVSRTSLAGIFYEPNVESYYRPFRLLPLKLVEIATGYYHTEILHAINLVFQVIVGYLAGIVVWKIYPHQRALGYLTAIIYLIFPFNYQVIPWVSALTHLMTATGTLLAVYFAEDWWETRRWQSWLVVCAGVILAVFSHENGVAAIYALGLLFVLRPQRLREWQALAIFFAPVALISAAFVGIWVSIPKEHDLVSVTLADIVQNYLYLSQGMGFPLVQFASVFESLAITSGLGIAGVLSAICVIAILAIGKRDSFLPVLWYFGIISIPSLFLTYSYVYDGPRLMLLASIGAALAWAVLIEKIWHWQKWLSVALGLFVVLSGGVFVYERMHLHNRLDMLYDGMFERVATHGDGAFVNLPAWLTYTGSRYPAGSEGITYMTNYFGPSDLVELNTGVDAIVLGYLVPALRPDLERYWWDVASPQPPLDEIATSIVTLEAGYIFVEAGKQWLWDEIRLIGSPEIIENYTFENGVQLVNPSAMYTGNGIIEMTLTWQIPDEIATNAQPFVHLACPDSPLVTQVDGMPLRGLLDFAYLTGDSYWQDTRYLHGAPSNNQDCFIRAGLFDVANAVQIPLVGSGESTIQVEIDYP